MTQLTDARPAEKARKPLIDFVRGLAVLMMIAYHTAYFADYNGLADVPLFESDFWFYSPRVIVSLFMLCSGASLYLSCRDGIRWGRYLRRLGILSLLAGGITLGTWIFFRENFIFTGILHCAAGASILVLPFLTAPLIRRPWIALGAGAALIVLSRLNILPNLPPHIEGVVSMDYIPVLPWAAPVFIGVFLGSLAAAAPSNMPGSLKNDADAPGGIIPLPRFYGNPVSKAVLFLGRRSLLVYFIHIAIIFGITMGIAEMLR
ncbi:MAG: DUF1624 domain-containing protein [Spirochaetales bacterium]|nr:MAG: DUF1624 domain-containing protein [Spirochaetales bacterium]